ncbi:MAG TPA: hypothetical protein VLT59_16230 [Steroidobacteraceae bacterium]|nr:hypothetical protein [Steroidobacteraceae bacterium]
MLELEGSRVACRQARIGGDLPEIGRQDLAGTIVYDRASGDVDLALTGLAVAGGQVDINGSLHASAWQIEASVAKADTVELARVLSRMGTEVAGFAATAGSLDGEFTARGSADGLEEIEFALSATGLSVGNEAGTVATDGLGLSVQGRLQPATHGW